MKEPDTPKSTISIPNHQGASKVKKETPSLFRRKEPKAELELQDAEQIEEKSEAFDQEKLDTVWSEYRAMRLEKGAGDTEQLVLSRELVKENEHDTKITLASQLEVSILERFEQDIVQFLRKSLNNTLLQLFKEVHQQETSKKLYTSKDKFDFMVQQNPALKEMKERLGLDFDY